MHPSSRARGIAEIETLFGAIFILILLLLVRGAGHIGQSRVDTAADSAFQALHDAANRPVPFYSPNIYLDPLPGLADARPDLPPLPNRFHAARSTLPISRIHLPGTIVPSITVESVAGVPGGDQTYSSYPVPSDAAATEAWFSTFAAESHAYLQAPFQLAPSWTP